MSRFICWTGLKFVIFRVLTWFKAQFETDLGPMVWSQCEHTEHTNISVCFRLASHMCRLILHSGRKLIQHSHTEDIKRLILAARQAEITLREKTYKQNGEGERLSSGSLLQTSVSVSSKSKLDASLISDRKLKKHKKDKQP